MNKRHLLPIPTILLSSPLAVVLSVGCEEVAEIGTKIARGTGTISTSQANSIKRSSKAIEKTQQELTPEQEYYIGRAVATTVFQTYSSLDRPQANNYRVSTDDIDILIANWNIADAPAADCP